MREDDIPTETTDGPAQAGAAGSKAAGLAAARSPVDTAASANPASANPAFASPAGSARSGTRGVKSGPAQPERIRFPSGDKRTAPDRGTDGQDTGHQVALPQAGSASAGSASDVSGPVPLAALSGVVPRWAVIGLFILALGASISATRAFLMPATMAILLFFVFSPLRRRLGRRGVPDWVTASLVSLALVAGIGAIGAFVTGPAEQLINDAPQIIRDVQAKFDALAASFPMLERLGIGGSFGLQDTAVGDAAMAAAPDSTAVMLQVATITPGVLGELLFVLVLLFFMMTSGDLLYLKIVQSFDTMGDKRNAYLALRQIEERLGNYLGAITIINVGLGIMIGVVLWVLGMPAPALFGMMATLLNFIPYLGVLIGAAMATAVALVSMDGFATPLLVGAAYVAICAVEGQFITPFFLSRRLEMNTVVVFLAVALWAWLWSVVGMIVAVPILVVVRVLCEHIPGTEKIANFLGGPDADSVMADGDADTAPPGVSASG